MKPVQRNPTKRKIRLSSDGLRVRRKSWDVDSKAMVEFVLLFIGSPPPVLYGAPIRADMPLDPKFFPKLASKTGLHALAILNVTAGKKGMRLALGLHNEHLVVPSDDGAGE